MLEPISELGGSVVASASFTNQMFT